MSRAQGDGDELSPAPISPAPISPAATSPAGNSSAGTSDEAGPARVSTARHGALLEILMRETLDPGYAEAAQRKAAQRQASQLQAPSEGIWDGAHTGAQAGRRRRSDRALTAAGAVLLGLLLVVAYLDANRSAPTDARVQSDLRHRVVQAEHDNSGLTRTAGALQSQIDGLGSAALGPGDTRRLHGAELAAGDVAVQGEGLRVVVGNPSIAASATATGRRGSVGISAVSVLTDTDVRSIVNELWADGAEAIAVDNVRLTPISAIRFAGQAVLVDFQPVAAPYTIAAIGPADALDTDFTSSSVADRFRTLASADGFRFTITQESHVSLPASAGAGPRYARPPAARSSGASSSSATTPTSPASQSSPSTGSSASLAPTPGAGPTS